MSQTILVAAFVSFKAVFPLIPSYSASAKQDEKSEDSPLYSDHILNEFLRGAVFINRSDAPFQIVVAFVGDNHDIDFVVVMASAGIHGVISMLDNF
ncbi:MAG: hypothetical protein JRF64_02580 [Deltaproteobacteria bacterium]|nr:hypothetical protein [Deltaproteobacteria bacterium]